MITSEIDNLYYILLMQPTGILSVRNGGIFLENDFWTNFVHGSYRKCLNLTYPVAAALGP